MKKILLLVVAAAVTAFTFSGCSEEENTPSGPAKYGTGNITFTLKYKPNLTTETLAAFPSGTMVKATVTKEQFIPARSADMVKYYKVGSNGSVKIDITAPYIYTDMKEFAVMLETAAIISGIVVDTDGETETHRFEWFQVFPVVAGEKFDMGEYLVMGQKYIYPGEIETNETEEPAIE